MIEEEKSKENSSELLNEGWDSSLQALYETAQQLSREKKAQLIKKLIDNSDMSLSLRVEITGSSKMTVLNLNLDSRGKIAETIEMAASKLEQLTFQEEGQERENGL